ncbi:hypothetical protein EJB05_28649, partial [Eragrostis curvula]
FHGGSCASSLFSLPFERLLPFEQLLHGRRTEGRRGATSGHVHGRHHCKRPRPWFSSACRPTSTRPRPPSSRPDLAQPNPRSLHLFFEGDDYSFELDGQNQLPAIANEVPVSGFVLQQDAGSGTRASGYAPSNSSGWRSVWKKPEMSVPKSKRRLDGVFQLVIHPLDFMIVYNYNVFNWIYAPYIYEFGIFQDVKLLTGLTAKRQSLQFVIDLMECFFFFADSGRRGGDNNRKFLLLGCIREFFKEFQKRNGISKELVSFSGVLQGFLREQCDFKKSELL